MNLREFYRIILEKHLLIVILLILLFSVLLSISIYLKKVHLSQNTDLVQLGEIKSKIKRLQEFKVFTEKYPSFEINKSELMLAKLLDSISERFPELKTELSLLRKEGEAFFLPYSIKGEVNFQRFLQVLDFLNSYSYPICLINSVYLKSKDNFISFEIKGEIGLVK